MNETVMPAHPAQTTPLVVANARLSPSCACAFQPLARILLVARKRDVPSLAAHRAGMSALAPGVLAGLVRDERDRA